MIFVFLAENSESIFMTESEKKEDATATTAKVSNKPKPNSKAQKLSYSSSLQQSRSSKKIKKIILHIGTRKTGSTTLQGILRDNQDAIREQGFNLVIARGKSFKEFYLSIVGGTPTWINWIETCHKACHSDGVNNLIISSEDLFYLSEWKIAELVAFCKTLAEKVEVHVFIRRQDDYLESSYTQYTTAGLWVGNIQDNFESFLAGTINNLDYKYQVMKWSAAVGKRNFRPLFYVRANTAQVFLDNLGLKVKSDGPSKSRNRREPVDMLRASIAIGELISKSYGLPIHCFSQMNKKFDFRKHVRHPLTQAFESLGRESEKYHFLGKNHMQILENEFAESNKNLLTNFSGAHDEHFCDFSGKGIKVEKLKLSNMDKSGIGVVTEVLSTQLAALGRLTD